MRMLVLLLLVLVAPGFGDEPAIPAEQLRAAITKSLPLLMKGAVGHREHRECFSCHNQGVPILALTTARSRGFEIDEAELTKQLDFITTFLKTNRDKFLQGKGTGGQVDTAGYALLALEVGGRKPDDTTSAVTEYLLLFQQDADHWKNSSNRPPSEGGEFTTTYLGLRGLQSYGTTEQHERITARRNQVRNWLAKAEPKSTEDHVFRLRTMQLLELPAEEVAAAAKALLDLQRSDGGWGQLTEMESDAYATGTTLVALHQAGKIPTTDPAYQRGLQYLLKTQQKDGSWHVKSRSKPFQTYFETGFPHGKDQFISAAASAWSTTALLFALEK
jgi:hypothetical protein